MKKELELESIKTWMPGIERPLIISGPCSAETENQMITTAKQLAATGKVHALRAGIWKPRTRPGQFEGAGEEGLMVDSIKKRNWSSGRYRSGNCCTR
jgi:chorismate mutase